MAGPQGHPGAHEQQAQPNAQSARRARHCLARAPCPQAGPQPPGITALTSQQGCPQLSQCGEGCGHCRPVRFFQICHPGQGELCAAQHEAATLCAGPGPAGQTPSQAGEEVVPGAPLTCPAACPVTLLCVPNQAWKQKWQKKGECFGGGQPRAPAQDSCSQHGQLSQWASRCPQPGKASDLDASLLTGVSCSLGRQFWLKQRPY